MFAARRGSGVDAYLALLSHGKSPASRVRDGYTVCRLQDAPDSRARPRLPARCDSMKIDKRNPRHWVYLAAFAVASLLAIVLRPLVSRRDPPLVLLYGHKLNGNLMSLYALGERAACELVFLTMDPAYQRELRADGVRSVLAYSPAGVRALAGARAIVSDHGLHALSWWPRLGLLRFADVWHGIPFKGWDERDFRVQQAYDEVWVSSSLMRRHYIERFGFRETQVHVTGYGRTDRLVRADEDLEPLRRRLDLPAGRRVVMFAPTWQHGTGTRSIFPFDSPPEEFLAMLADVCRAHDAVCLFRTHLNSGLGDGPLPSEVFRCVPQGEWPDSEGLLLLSDLLVCDWSSIAFDFLLLERPTIFLDVPAPFPKGFTLGPEYRFGAVVASVEALGEHLVRYLARPEQYAAEHGERARRITGAVYDDKADGHAAERYLARLQGLLAS